VNSSSIPPSNELQCQLLDEKVVNCSSQVYNNKNAWRTSRSFINEQIRRLRAQLSELKVTRIDITYLTCVFSNGQRKFFVKPTLAVIEINNIQL